MALFANSDLEPSRSELAKSKKVNPKERLKNTFKNKHFCLNFIHFCESVDDNV